MTDGMPRGLLRAMTAALVSGLIGGCALFAPLPEKSELADRLAAFPTRGLPLEGEVVVHWDDHQIPFIEAEHDADAAFALGLVHAQSTTGRPDVDTWRKDKPYAFARILRSSALVPSNPTQFVRLFLQS